MGDPIIPDDSEKEKNKKREGNKPEKEEKKEISTL
jgi:hypothetical protein